MPYLHKLQITDIRQALTSAMYQSYENYETLEFLGDTVLKVLGTLQIFCENQTSNEHDMHVSRIQVISNANLKRIGIKNLVTYYIKTSKTSFLPFPGVEIAGLAQFQIKKIMQYIEEQYEMQLKKEKEELEQQ